MGLRQSPPGGGPGRPTYWTHVRTPRGMKAAWHAWVAGPIHWYVCHDLKRTKPCVHQVTNGEVSCAWCDGLIPTSTKGYIPLYRYPDGKPVYELLYDDAREELDKLKLHERVMVFRGPLQNDIVHVLRLSEQSPAWQTSDAEKRGPRDITVSLLRMWKIPELIAWYNVTEARNVPQPKVDNDNVVSLKSRLLDGVGGTVEDFAALALGERVSEVERLKRHAEAIERGKSAARNGKHKPATE